jgi:hypothetical protein
LALISRILRRVGNERYFLESRHDIVNFPNTGRFGFVKLSEEK